jgi:hypothetical protein
MTLPNYFLADLPPEAPLTGTMIREACQSLKRNRAQYLAERSTSHLVKIIGDTAANWLEEDFPMRRLALERGPAAAGFPRVTLAKGLDAFFKTLTRENLNELVQQELGHDRRLDELSETPAEAKSLQAAVACGPELLVHIAAGNIPNPTLLSLVLGLLTRSAQFMKCARGTSLLPRLFAHSLHEAEPKLAACIEIAEWRGGDETIEGPLFNEADCVTATGSDETLRQIQRRLPAAVRFLGYGHRVSFGYVAHEVLSEFGLKKVLARAVDDIVAWNQLGCLSPHVFYVESGGSVSSELFAERLADGLAEREVIEPRGELLVADSAQIASRRDIYQMRAAATGGTRLWCSDGSTAWTVVHESDPRFQLSCGNRFIYVKGVRDLAEALHHADPVHGQVSTVGLAAHDDTARALALQLARWGVTRVCPLGRMQNPPLTWRHDGRPPLGDLVVWTNWER